MSHLGSRETLNKFSSFRVLAGFWLLGAMVIVNSYSGIVISSLTVPTMKPGIDSFEDLAASKDVGVVLRYDVSIGEQILVNLQDLFVIYISSFNHHNLYKRQQQAKSGIYKEIADKARRNPDQIVGDPFKLNNLLETGRYAYPFVSSFKITSLVKTKSHALPWPKYNMNYYYFSDSNFCCVICRFTIQKRRTVPL